MWYLFFRAIQLNFYPKSQRREVDFASFTFPHMHTSDKLLHKTKNVYIA